jgi:hypothetical protein
MKKILYLLLAVILAICLVLPTNAYASENEEAEGAVNYAPSEAQPVETEEPDIFTRLYEAFCENKSDIFTIGGSAALFVLSILLKKDLGSTSKNIVSNIAHVLAKSDIAEEKQTAIVDGLNEMVDGYNEIKDQSRKVGERVRDAVEQIERITTSQAHLETKIDGVFNALIALIDKGILQNAEIMDVLSSVYVNNDALPKGIKDYVALKRAANAKLVQEAAHIVQNGEVSDE